MDDVEEAANAAAIVVRQNKFAGTDVSLEDSREFFETLIGILQDDLNGVLDSIGMAES